MDKEIKKVKKHIDKDMKGLLKKDIKHDKKCEADEKMAKKKKKEMTPEQLDMFVDQFYWDEDISYLNREKTEYIDKTANKKYRIVTREDGTKKHIEFD